MLPSILAVINLKLPVQIVVEVLKGDWSWTEDVGFYCKKEYPPQ